MSIDSPLTILTALVVALLATGLLALVWDRRRVLGRLALVAAVVLAVTSTAALQLNSLLQAYPSWADLVGNSSPDVGGMPSPGVISDNGSEPDRKPGHGRTISVVLAGKLSGMTMPMTVYLPAAYDTPAGQRLKFPVVEALHGYPGTPETWLRRLDITGQLDKEIAAGRMAPTVVLLPYQTTDRLLDTECTNLTGGPQSETYLTKDVRQWAIDNLRVRSDQPGWGLIGYSAGGFCAMNLLLKHPDLYAAGASLSGQAEPGMKVGDGSEKTTNSVTWRLANRPPPPVALYLGWSLDESSARLGSQKVARMAKAPITVTTATVARGGHSQAVWKQMESPAFDWLSANLARPQPTLHDLGKAALPNCPPAAGKGKPHAPPSGAPHGKPVPPAGGSHGKPSPPAGGSHGKPTPPAKPSHPAGGTPRKPPPSAGGSHGKPQPPAGCIQERRLPPPPSGGGRPHKPAGSHPPVPPPAPSSGRRSSDPTGA